jgi:hypoxanthine phosphoribosyltransferase
MTILTHPSYDDIHAACVQLATYIQHSPRIVDCVIGLTRGGLLPAVIMSHLLNLPITPVNYSSKHGAGDNKDHDNFLPIMNHRSILFVDDICDSGKTLVELYKHYDYVPYKQTAVIYYKESAVFEPTYFVHQIPKDSPWIIFPWEGLLK